MALYAGYGNNIFLHGADALVVHRSQDARVVILEYDVHGKIIRTGASYDNRFISVVTIEDRKIGQWRAHIDTLTSNTPHRPTPQPRQAAHKLIGWAWSDKSIPSPP